MQDRVSWVNIDKQLWTAFSIIIYLWQGMQ